MRQDSDTGGAHTLASTLLMPWNFPEWQLTNTHKTYQIFPLEGDLGTTHKNSVEKGISDVRTQKYIQSWARISPETSMIRPGVASVSQRDPDDCGKRFI